MGGGAKYTTIGLILIFGTLCVSQYSSSVPSVMWLLHPYLLSASAGEALQKSKRIPSGSCYLILRGSKNPGFVEVTRILDLSKGSKLMTWSTRLTLLHLTHIHNFALKL